MIEYEIELRSDIGTREEQQDYAEFYKDEGMVFAVLCDGMGGHQGGYLASATAVRSFISDSAQIGFDNIPAFFIDKAEETNIKIYNLSNNKGDRLKAGTTLASVIIKDNKLYWLSIGDSRIYIIRDNRIKQITKDHNYFFILDSMLKDGVINENEYKKKAEDGNALISYLGIKKLDLIDINIEPFQVYNNDMILLTSDGLTKLLDDDTIVGCFDDSADKYANRLLEYVHSSNVKPKDNTTFILIKIKEI